MEIVGSGLSFHRQTVAAPTPVIVLTPHSAVQSGICLLICATHPGSYPLGNEQQAGRNPLIEPQTAHWCVDTRGG